MWLSLPSFLDVSPGFCTDVTSNNWRNFTCTISTPSLAFVGKTTICFNLEVLDDAKSTSTQFLIIKARGCGWNTSSEWITIVCHTGCFTVFWSLAPGSLREAYPWIIYSHLDKVPYLKHWAENGKTLTKVWFISIKSHFSSTTIQGTYYQIFKTNSIHEFLATTYNMLEQNYMQIPELCIIPLCFDF